MKATGIVRRVDDLGRIVIPKEIRRTLRIREGDPLLTTLTVSEKYLWAMKMLQGRIGVHWIILVTNLFILQPRMAALAVQILKNTGCQRFHRIPSASTHGEAGSSVANWQCKSNEVSSSIIVRHNRSPWLQSVMGICYFIKSLLFSVRPSLQDGYCDVRSNTRPTLALSLFRSGIYRFSELLYYRPVL